MKQDVEGITLALTEICNNKALGRRDAASAWAAELCRLLGCADILNARGQELRRDYHAGPRDAAMEGHFQ